MYANRSLSAFTRVEILIIVILIVLVASLLYPIIGSAREKRRMSTCMSSQRAIATNLLAIAQDNDNTFPEFKLNAKGSDWYQMIVDQMDLAQLPACPDAYHSGKFDEPTYGINPNLAGKSLKALPAINKVLLLADGTAWLLTTIQDVATTRHNYGYLATFADGHLARFYAVDSSIIFRDGDEGTLFSFGAMHIPITFHDSMTAVGKDTTVEEGAVITLYNDTDRDIEMTVTVIGGTNPPDEGVLHGTAPVRLTAHKYRSFALYCGTNTAAQPRPTYPGTPSYTAPQVKQKVETQYVFGAQEKTVTITVKKPMTPSIPLPVRSGTPLVNPSVGNPQPRNAVPQNPSSLSTTIVPPR